MTPVRLEPTASPSRVKHSTTELSLLVMLTNFTLYCKSTAAEIIDLYLEILLTINARF